MTVSKRIAGLQLKYFVQGRAGTVSYELRQLDGAIELTTSWDTGPEQGRKIRGRGEWQEPLRKWSSRVLTSTLALF